MLIDFTNRRTILIFIGLLLSGVVGAAYADYKLDYINIDTTTYLNVSDLPCAAGQVPRIVGGAWACYSFENDSFNELNRSWAGRINFGNLTNCTTNQIMKFVGGAWACAADDSVAGGGYSNASDCPATTFLGGGNDGCIGYDPFWNETETANTTEQMQDACGEMDDGVETGITVVYNDAANEMDYTVTVVDTTISNASDCPTSNFLSGQADGCYGFPEGWNWTWSNSTQNDSYHWFDNTTIFRRDNSSYEWFDNTTIFQTYNETYDSNINTANTTEEMQDACGALLGGDETKITVTYDDGNNEIDFVVAESNNASNCGTGDLVLLGNGSCGQNFNNTIAYGAITGHPADADTANTTEEMQDACGAMATDGLGVDFTYNDGGNTLTPTFDCSDVVDSATDGIECLGEDLTINADEGILADESGLGFDCSEVTDSADDHIGCYNEDLVVSDDWWDEDADIGADTISESKIIFGTPCAAGNHYYLNGNDLACEANTVDTDTDTNSSNCADAALTILGNGSCGMNFNTSIHCGSIYGGGDGDYCEDLAGGSGGVNYWQVSGAWMFANYTAGGRGNVNFSMINTTNITSDDWSNVSITESQITDLTHITNASGCPADSFLAGNNEGCFGFSSRWNETEVANTTEEMQDACGALLGGTETGITVDYDDAGNDIDFVVTVVDTTISNASDCPTNNFLSGQADGCYGFPVGWNYTWSNSTQNDSYHWFDNATIFIDTDTANTTEEMQDACGALLGGDETKITVTYDDGNNEIDFVVAESNNASTCGTGDLVLLGNDSCGQNFNTSIHCGSIYGGGDGDYCEDLAGGSGGVNYWQVSGAWMFPNDTAGASGNINVSQLNASNITAGMINATWENVSITESQITDLSHNTYTNGSFTDLNRSWAGTIGAGNITNATIAVWKFIADLALGWANLTNYPSTCTASQYISAFGDTTSCAAIAITESQITDLTHTVNASGCPADSFLAGNNEGCFGFSSRWNETEVANTTEEMQDACGAAFGEGLIYNDGGDSMTFDCSAVTDTADDYLQCSGENLVFQSAFFAPLNGTWDVNNAAVTGNLNASSFFCGLNTGCIGLGNITVNQNLTMGSYNISTNETCYGPACSSRIYWNGTGLMISG